MLAPTWHKTSLYRPRSNDDTIMDHKYHCISILIGVLYHHIDLGAAISFLTSKSQRTSHRESQRQGNPAIFLEIIPAAVLFSFPPHSSVALLRPCAYILRQWPKLLPKSGLRRLPKWMTGDTGPFGYGCGKVCESICAYALLCIGNKNLALWPPPLALQMGSLPGVDILFSVTIFSAIVNYVLYMWSSMTLSKGNHVGVNAMMKDTLGRKLSAGEYIHIGKLAFINALCEEVVSRGFFYHAFIETCGMTKHIANFSQAASFGLWHYNGIPSGILGIALTFVYGLFMGILKEFGGGFFLPILAHTVADAFIFSVIARKRDDINNSDS